MTVRTRILGATLLVLALAFAVFGVVACGSSERSGGSGGSPSASAGPQSGGVFTMVASTEPAGLDPFVNWNFQDYAVFFQILEAPYKCRTNPDTRKTELVPGLAEDMPTFSNGGKTMTFKVRQGAMFQPPVSREVTAQDVKWSLESMLSNPNCPGTSYFSNIVGAQDLVDGKAKELRGVKAVDKYTVQVDLVQPDPVAAYPLSLQFAVVIPKEWVEKWGPEEIGQHPLGTGAYMLDSWNKGQEIVLKKNPDYWGTAYLESVRIKFNVNPQTQVLMVKSGDADVMIDNIPSADLPTIKANPQWSEQVAEGPGAGVIYMYLNTRMAPFDNVDVRNAVAWAIDREKLVKLLGGLAVPSYQFLPEGIRGRDANQKWGGYDPAKAKELLAQSGNTNLSTTIWAYAEDPYPTVFESIQNDLKEIGIDATLKTMAKAQFVSYRMKPGKTPAGTFGWYMDYPDPTLWFDQPWTKLGISPTGYNPAFYADPSVEKALEAAQAEFDLTVRDEKLRGVQEMGMADMPYVPLYQPSVAQLVNPRVGLYFPSQFLILQLQDYWLK